MWWRLDVAEWTKTRYSVVRNIEYLGVTRVWTCTCQLYVF